MDQEEVHSAHAGERGAHLHLYLFLRAHLALLTRDLDDSALTSRPSLVFKRSCQRLVAAGDHLVDGELERAGEVVSGQVADIALVVDVVDLQLELLPPLKVILHVEALDPDRIQVVHDDLSHAEALPLGAHLLVKDNHAVGARESIQVWQVLAGEAEADGLDEAALRRADALVDGGEDGVVEVAANAHAGAGLHRTLVLVRPKATHVVSE